jgi:dTDP-4-dehydrorhamnose 3,5-epimerase
MSFRFEKLEIPGMILVETTLRRDDRGFFQESYQRSAFQEAGIREEFCQDNFAHSTKGVLRGLHFQHPPQAQGKLVQLSLGAVWDVGVDLREGSPTFGAWLGVELAEGTGRMLYLPPGFAHGYLVLSEVADLAYKVTSEYAPELDAGIRWDDPQIGVDWPSKNPILSQKDLELPSLEEITSPFLFAEGEEEE